MRIYSDLHCDTATVMYTNKKNFSDNLHISRKSLSSFDTAVQFFSIFVDDIKVKDGFDYFNKTLDYFLPLVKEEKNILPLVSVEGGGAIINDNKEYLMTLKRRGVRMFGLVWNGENTLATGALKDNSKGLTDAGKEMCKLLEQENIYPDISHLSDRGFWDLAETTSMPIIASHSNSRSVYNHLRNLTDEQAAEIIRRKGLIGINLYPDIIAQNPKLSDLIRHVEHFMSLGGKNCLFYLTVIKQRGIVLLFIIF